MVREDFKSIKVKHLFQGEIEAQTRFNGNMVFTSIEARFYGFGKFDTSIVFDLGFHNPEELVEDVASHIFHNEVPEYLHTALKEGLLLIFTLGLFLWEE
ncbi:MAG: hypothetical protein ACRCX8_20235 [Sarcina sp.]